MRQKHMIEKPLAGTAADRIAIERWEDEGGRALTLEEELLRAWPRSEPKNGIASRAGSHARSVSERVPRS
jgi:hypothetical protein